MSIDGADISFEVTVYPASIVKCFTKKCNETWCEDESEFRDFDMVRFLKILLFRFN